MNDIVWQDGRIQSIREAYLPAGAPCILEARAAFDGCRVFVREREGRAKPFTIGLSLHLARLANSCAALGLSLPYTANDLAQVARNVVRFSEPACDAGLRWFVTETDANSVDGRRVIVSVFVRSLQGYTRPGAYRLTVADQARRMDVGIPFTVKTMAHYATTRRFTMAARAQGYDDCLFVNQRGHVTEAPRANLVFLAGREIHSPPTSDGVLDGITRALLRRVVEYDGALRWIERSIPVDTLRSYSGALMLSSSLGVVPVEQIGPFHFGTQESWRMASLWSRAVSKRPASLTSLIDDHDD